MLRFDIQPSKHVLSTLLRSYFLKVKGNLISCDRLMFDTVIIELKVDGSTGVSDTFFASSAMYI